MATTIDTSSNIAFFGRVSWGNLVDWLVTLCVGSIIVLTTVSLGGVWPDTHLLLLPLYVVLLCLHGLWLAVDRESPKRLNYLPLLFVPGLLWMLCSVLWLSPVPWRGCYEIIYVFEAFLVLWVLANNVRTRAHLWLLIIMSLMPAAVAIFNGFYQFFQDPAHMAGTLTNYNLQLNKEFLGRATGVFADPNSFGVFLLLLLPSLLVAASVSRLPIVLRILSFYIAVMFCAGIALTQSYWASAMGVVLLSIVPLFCFRTLKRRILFSSLGVLSALLVLGGLVSFHPFFKKGLAHALSDQGEGIRLVLWKEAVAATMEAPLTGVGAGAYSASFEQSPRVALAVAPHTPHNDYLLLWNQLGTLGVLLLGAPCLYVFFEAWKRWRKEPFAVRRRHADGLIMPTQRFFLSLGLCGAIAFALCMMTTFVFYVPALVLYGVLAFSILLKSTFSRRLVLLENRSCRIAYFLIACFVGGAFYVLGAPKLEAQALELRARQQFEYMVNMRAHMLGDAATLDQVIELYENAVLLDAGNADAWIGLSAAVCQLYFRNPAGFEPMAERAVACAERGVELSPHYWKPWTQLGVARAFYGDEQLAEDALVHALGLAPNNSNAHYYYADFLSMLKGRGDEALSHVRIALDINPQNAAARRLQQKLLIL